MPTLQENGSMLLRLILIAVSLDPSQQSTESDTSNQDYFSIGAHLNADSFGKHLRKWLDSRLKIELLKDHLVKQKWETASLNLPVVEELSRRLDERIGKLAGYLPELAAPMGSSSYISCHSIHELVRLSPTQPCAIRASDTGTPPKYKLEPLLHPLIYRQFLLSEDVLFEFPAEFLPPRIHSGPIVSSLLPFKKNIVLLLDTGSLSTQEQVDTVRLVSNQILETVSYRDHVAVYVTDGSAIHSLGCGRGVLLKAVRQNLDELKSSIHNLEPPKYAVPTQHGSVLSRLITLLNGTDHNGGKTIFTYISRGVLENLEDAAVAIRKVTDAISKSQEPIRINTLLLSDDRRSTSVWSQQFMDNLAKRNSTREDRNYVEGLSLTVEKNMMLDLYDVQELLDWQDQSPTEEVMVSIPTSSTRTVVMTKYWFQNDSDVVAGIEIPLMTLFSSTIHNSSLNCPGIQSHLVTPDGNIVVSSAGWEDMPLSEVDHWSPSSKWLEHSWEGSRGELEVLNQRDNKTTYYLWSKLNTLPFILVVSSSSPFPRERTFLSSEKKMTSLLRHLVPHETVKESVMRCSQFGKEVIPGTAALYLPGYITTHPTTDYWLYLTDTVGMIPSNGLRQGVREQVAVLNAVLEQWVSSSKMDEAAVFQKFAVTSEGVLVVYPAAEIANRFDPKKQEWYKEAVRKPNTVVITGPRQDLAVGDIVTLSIAVEHKKEVFTVLGVEVSSSFLGKLLKDSVSSCNESRHCVLFTRQGRVAFSDKVYQNSEVVERFHISHLEPLLTSDMAANQKLVKKTLCQQGTITKRQFEWNSEYTRVHTTSCGDARRGGSVASEVLVVPGSQFLLAMVNSSCTRTPVTVFCPCSVHDGRCLFCGKFDSLECECPCTCPACVDRQLPHCPVPPHNDQMIVTSGMKDMPSCNRAECSSLLHQDGCISSTGCSWCQFSSTLQPLLHPQCRPVTMCYGGVFGRSPSPKSPETVQQAKWLTPTPVGPLVAGFMVVVIVLVGAAWCYRNYARRLVSHNCNHSVDSAPLFGPTAEIECDPTVFKEERIPVQLAFFEREVVREVPPPPPSDHGYSTMTERNDDTTSAVSTALTDQPSSIVSKPLRRFEPAFPPMTALITMAEVHEEPQII